MSSSWSKNNRKSLTNMILIYDLSGEVLIFSGRAMSSIFTKSLYSDSWSEGWVSSWRFE